MAEFFRQRSQVWRRHSHLSAKHFARYADLSKRGFPLELISNFAPGGG